MVISDMNADILSAVVRMQLRMHLLHYASSLSYVFCILLSDDICDCESEHLSNALHCYSRLTVPFAPRQAWANAPCLPGALRVSASIP